MATMDVLNLHGGQPANFVSYITVTRAVLILTASWTLVEVLPPTLSRKPLSSC